MKKLNTFFAVLSVSAMVHLGGCASMVGLDKPGVHTVMVETENGQWVAEGTVTAILLKEYQDDTGGESFGRGLVQGAAGLLGPVGSLAAAGGDMAYESQKKYKTFPILTVKVGDKEVQVIQPYRAQEGYEHMVFEQEFAIGDRVRIEANKTTPPHAIKLVN